MKIFIVLALVTIAAADWKPLSRQALKQTRLNCMKDLNLSQDLKDKVNHQEYPNTPVMKSYILCGARGSQLWQDDKGWMADRILLMLEGDATMTKAELLDNIKACLDDNSQGSSLEEWAYRNHKCMTDGKLKDAFKRLMKKIE